MMLLSGVLCLALTARAGEIPENPGAGGDPPATPPPSSATPGASAPSASRFAEAPLEAGDHAWWTGDRPRARRIFREAFVATRAEVKRLRAAGEPLPPELLAREARLRLRLIRLGSNLTPSVHAGPMFAALDACPSGTPACDLAESELALLLPRWAGGNPALVDGILGDSVFPAALARRAAANGGSLLEALRALPPETLDGAGLGIVESGNRVPEDPGTRTLAFGLGGAPGAGLGANLLWVDPDLNGTKRRLDLQVAADTRGGGLVGGGLAGVHARGRASAARTVLDDWRSGGRVLVPLDALRGEFAWGEPLGGKLRGELGVEARAEAAGAWGAGWGAATGEVAQDWQLAAGPLATLTWAGRAGSARAHASSGFGDYTHLGLGVDARGRARLPLNVEVAGRGLVESAPTAGTPWWRLPTAGGSQLLRGAPLGRWRAPSLVGAQVELRRVIAEGFRGAMFLDAALPGDTAAPGWGVTGADLHATAGAGLRMGVPGMEHASTRLDVGWSLDAATRGQWGVVVGVGEAF